MDIGHGFGRLPRIDDPRYKVTHPTKDNGNARNLTASETPSQDLFDIPQEILAERFID